MDEKQSCTTSGCDSGCNTLFICASQRLWSLQFCLQDFCLFLCIPMTGCIFEREFIRMSPKLQRKTLGNPYEDNLTLKKQVVKQRAKRMLLFLQRTEMQVYLREVVQESG